MQDVESLFAHALPQAQVEAGERLVHEKHARPRRDGSRKRHALLLTAGEDMRVFVGVVVEPDAGERGKRFCLRLGSGERAQPEGDILQDGEMGEEREVLKHQADATLLRRNEIVGPSHLLAVEQHAARGRALDAGGDPEERGLAAAGGTKQAEDFSRRHVERDVVEGKALAIALGHIGENELGGKGDARPALLMARFRAPAIPDCEKRKHSGCLRCRVASRQQLGL